MVEPFKLFITIFCMSVLFVLGKPPKFLHFCRISYLCSGSM